MRALVIRDNELFVETRPDPVPGPGEVLVAVRAAGLNAADLLQRRGLYPAPPGWPVDIPGLELAGDVRAWGSGVQGLSVGQRVCAIVGGGAHATYCLVPSEHLLAVPPGVEISNAGGFPEAFVTAFDALICQARMEFGDRVLISGAAGGVGSAALQLVRACGAVPIAVTRDDAPHKQLLQLGALEVATVETVTSVAPVDIILELVGAAHLQTAMSVLAPHGRVVVIGIGSGAKVEIDLLSIMTKRLSLMGSTLRSRSREEKTALCMRVTAELLPHWAAHRIHVPVSQHFRLEEAPAAYDAFATSGKFGKIVLTMQP